jgi:hypothetical protein
MYLLLSFSFACGSVALFVPTPLGDYIGFHEGCPHYYLSMESIEAAKIDGKNPPYVLGCIVFIEDYETTAVCCSKSFGSITFDYVFCVYFSDL